MKTKELKDELLAWLSGVEDEDVLQAVAAVRDGGLEDLTEEQLEMIRQGEEDVKAGRYISAEEFARRYGQKV